MQKTLDTPCEFENCNSKCRLRVYENPGQLSVVMVSKIGADIGHFETPHRLAAWSEATHGRYERGGKALSGRVRQSSWTWRSALLPAADATAHQSETYLFAPYRRTAYRRDSRKAGFARVHSILLMACRLMERNRDYEELGGDYFDKHCPEVTPQRLIRRLEQLGYQIVLHPRTAAALSAV